MLNIRLSEGETVKMVLRQPKALLYFKLSLFLFALLAPWKFLYDYELANKFISYLIIWSILVSTLIFLKYFSWLTNINLLTNKKIILVKFNFLIKKVTEIEVQSITNISVHKNIVQNIFDLGDLRVSIVGQLNEFNLSNVEKPDFFKAEVFKIQSK